MTRAQAEAFLEWIETGRQILDRMVAAQQDGPPALEEPPQLKLLRESLGLIAPAGEIIQVIFNGLPGEGLSVKADERGVVQEVYRVLQKRPPLALM